MQCNTTYQFIVGVAGKGWVKEREMEVVMKCENCGSDVVCDEDTLDGHILLEQHYECDKCGFRRHWAYGYITPDDSEFEENGDNELHR